MASAIHQVKQGDRNGGYYPDSDNPKHVQPNEEGTTNISVRAGLGGLWLPIVNPQPESGSVAKNVMGKIHIYVFRQSIRR
eukprot:1158328-Pelagomonas_calceolata.AAC.1